MTKLQLRREKADHQPARIGHAEEIAGMHPDTFLEEGEDRLRVRLQRRNSEDRVPAAFDFEPLD